MFLRVYMGVNWMTFNNSIDEVYFKSPNTVGDAQTVGLGLVYLT